MVARRQYRGCAGRVLPLDTVRECFVRLVSGPEPLSVDGRAFHGLPQRAVPLDEVRGLLMRRGCPRLTRDAVWALLVRRARREDGVWTLACAGMALPALAGVVRRLDEGCAGDAFDLQAEVVAGFLDGLARVDVVRPRVLTRLRWAAYRRGFATRAQAWDAPTPVAPGYWSAAPQPPWGHPDLVLARAVREGAVPRAEAELIGSTRLDDMTVAEWAQQHALTPNAVYKTRRRAEAQLATFLRGEAVDATVDDPVARAAMDLLLSTPQAPARRSTAPASAASPTRAVNSSSGMAKKGADSGFLGCGSDIPASPSAPEGRR
ncbi:sigma-70 family RNA polymerase sigma factor [Streptomyces roseirectus]|uniref:Sigma-70 family RNA polymerase sigma factor n=1 Tax=Streptomyces roseirectus TaxID=2768066 RepID=A0A7H0I7Q6_9ACTN|nr:sigma-70 family RNA polymerase sigma factor [Streptomyces roseirectus]QNP68822.1 sigma-70 family RNA polymerase sigma factor [Streptomyces roseirectus]